MQDTILFETFRMKKNVLLIGRVPENEIIFDGQLLQAEYLQKPRGS